MFDPFAQIRADIERNIGEAIAAVDRICDYPARIRRAHEQGHLVERERLLIRRERDVDAVTGPLLDLYAQVPPPPMVVRLD